MKPRDVIWSLFWVTVTQMVRGQEKPILASMTWHPENGYQLVEDQLLTGVKEAVAIVNFTNAINQTGWSYLEVTTFPQFPDKVQVKPLGCHLSNVSSRLLEFNNGVEFTFPCFCEN